MAKRVLSAIDGGEVRDLETLAELVKVAKGELDRLIRAIQDGLNAFEIECEVWSSVWLAQTDWRALSDDPEDQRRESFATDLGYGPSGSGWALLVRTRRVVEFDPEDSSLVAFYECEPATPLLNASASVRAAAAKALCVLVEDVKFAAEVKLANVEAVRRVADSLKAKKPGTPLVD